MSSDNSAAPTPMVSEPTPSPAPPTSPDAAAPNPSPAPDSTPNRTDLAQAAIEMLRVIFEASKSHTDDQACGNCDSCKRRTSLDWVKEKSFYNQPDEALVQSLRQVSMERKQVININANDEAEEFMRIIVSTNSVPAMTYVTSGQDYWVLPPSRLAQFSCNLMHEALKGGCTEVARWLFQTGVDRFQPLHRANNEVVDALFLALTVHDYEATQWLTGAILEQSSDPSFFVTPRYKGRSPAFMAVHLNDPHLLNIFQPLVADWTQVLHKGDDIFQWCAYLGLTQSLQWFSDRNLLPDVNAPRGPQQACLLEEAAKHPETVRWLIDHGAHVNIPRVFAALWKSPQWKKVMKVVLAKYPHLADERVSTLLDDRKMLHCTVAQACRRREDNKHDKVYCFSF